MIFSKPPTSVIGPDDAIEHNAQITQQLDWEVELAVIIGSRAKRVSEEQALNYVFGYSLMIDMSARDCRRAGQWIYSKGRTPLHRLAHVSSPLMKSRIHIISTSACGLTA